MDNPPEDLRASSHFTTGLQSTLRANMYHVFAKHSCFDWLQTAHYGQCFQFEAFKALEWSERFLPHFISDGGVVFITQQKRSASPRASFPSSVPVGRNGNSGRSLQMRSRLTSHWRRPDPPAPGPRGLQPMPSPYGPNYPNWLPHGVTHGPPWPGRPHGVPMYNTQICP